MKHTLYKSVLALTIGGFLLTSTGCKKLEDFGDTNVNPLTSTEPITAALLSNAENGLGGIIAGTATGGVRAGLYVQYFAETQYTDASLFSEPIVDFGIYQTVLNDLQVIINRNSTPATAVKDVAYGSNANQIATATILKSYYLWTLTDRWGDIPYSEALKGAANTIPKFDKQEDVYTYLLRDLKAGIAGFDNGLAVKGDIIYDGDQAKWKKLANSLRMQIALRMSKRFPAAGGTAANEFAAAVTDPNGYISSNADNAVLNYPGGAQYVHPWYNIYDGRSDYAYSKTLADIVNNMNDNRGTSFGGVGTPFPYGLTRAQATSAAAPAPSAYALVLADHNDNTPLVVVAASYGLLAHAEAVERNWVPGDAKTLYDAGVTASFAQWGDAGAITVLTGKGEYNTGVGGGTDIGRAAAFPTVLAGQSAVTTTKLERLALQQYLAYYPDGIQGWSNWRRTNMPVLKPTTNATNSGKGIPRRYRYGITESNTNATNLAEAVARLSGGDEVSSRIWWDL